MTNDTINNSVTSNQSIVETLPIDIYTEICSYLKVLQLSYQINRMQMIEIIIKHIGYSVQVNRLFRYGYQRANCTLLLQADCHSAITRMISYPLWMWNIRRIQVRDIKDFCHILTMYRSWISDVRMKHKHPYGMTIHQTLDFDINKTFFVPNIHCLHLILTTIIDHLRPLIAIDHPLLTVTINSQLLTDCKECKQQWTYNPTIHNHYKCGASNDCTITNYCCYCPQFRIYNWYFCITSCSQCNKVFHGACVDRHKCIIDL